MKAQQPALMHGAPARCDEVAMTHQGYEVQFRFVFARGSASTPKGVMR